MTPVPVAPGKNISLAMDNSDPITVVIGIVQDAEKKILIAQRRQDVHLAGLWEFPGGKVEPGETLYTALVRELWEEVGLEVYEADLWEELHYQYPHKTVMLYFWRVSAYKGRAQGRENQPIRWVTAAELDAYEFPAANQPILKALKNLS